MEELQACAKLKRNRCKTPYTVWFHLYEMSRKDIEKQKADQ